MERPHRATADVITQGLQILPLDAAADHTHAGYLPTPANRRRAFTITPSHS